MMAKAVEQRWPMSSEVRAAIIQKLLKVMGSKDSSPREITSAAKAIMSAESQNQKDEHKDLDDFSNRLLELANRLGVDVSSIGIGEAPEE